MSRRFIKVFLVALLVQMIVFFPCWLFIGGEWTEPIRMLAFWFYLPAAFIAGPIAHLIAGAFENGLMLAITMTPIIGGLLYSCGIALLALGLARRAARRQIRP